jgi:hypothetical protein
MTYTRKVDSNDVSLNEDKHIIARLCDALYHICNEKDCAFIIKKRRDTYHIEGGTKVSREQINQEHLEQCCGFLHNRIKSLQKKIRDCGAGYSMNVDLGEFKVIIQFEFTDCKNGCAVMIQKDEVIEDPI